MFKNQIINKIKKDCLEVHEETSKFYTLVVGKKNVNKVVNELKGSGAELHFNYTENVLIDVMF